MVKNNNSGWIVWAVVAAILVLVAAGLSRQHSHNQCVNRAVAAAVDTYGIQQYPNTAVRSQLQDQYKNKYIAQNCQ